METYPRHRLYMHAIQKHGFNNMSQPQLSRTQKQTFKQLTGVLNWDIDTPLGNCDQNRAA